MDDLDHDINNIIDSFNASLLEHGIKPLRISLPGKKRKGYVYVRDNRGDWYRTKNFSAELPIWRKIRLAPQQLTEKERKRRQYERMMKRGKNR